MEVKYIRDFRHNYLVIKEKAEQLSGYSVKMITANEIKGLIGCQERMLNGEALLYYDITSKQNVKSILEAQLLQMAHLQQFFVSLQRVGESLRNYLLDVDGLLLDPEFVYMDMETFECRFIYDPQKEQSVEESLLLLMNFFMEHMDADDMKLTEGVYQVADLLKWQQFVLDEIIIWFEEHYGSERVEGNLQQIPCGESEMQNPVCEEQNREYRVPEALFEVEHEESLRERITNWFLRKLCGKTDQKAKSGSKMIQYRDGEEWLEEKQAPVPDHTVFIPWVENSDNKLYGIGKSNKYHISLEKLPLTVGKMAGAVDIVINEASVSRLHARLSREGNRFFITDLNSTNGTFRNGMRLEPNASEIIEPGDEIGIGKLKFIYR